MADGVMVTQRFLVPLFQVRALVGQLGKAAHTSGFFLLFPPAFFSDKPAAETETGFEHQWDKVGAHSGKTPSPEIHLQKPEFHRIYLEFRPE